MRQAVETYIKKCLSCPPTNMVHMRAMAKSNIRTHRNRHGDEVRMHFITELPKTMDPATGERYNSILIIVDKLTKYSHIIAFKEEFNAEHWDI